LLGYVIKLKMRSLPSNWSPDRSPSPSVGLAHETSDPVASDEVSMSSELATLGDLEGFIGSCPSGTLLAGEVSNQVQEEQIDAITKARRAIGKNWKNFAGRKDGEDGYRFGDVSRGIMKEVVSEAVPVVRDNLHRLRMGAVDVKERVLEGRHDMVMKAAKTLEVKHADISSKKDEELRRWWNIACAKMHSAHTADDNVPLLSQPDHSEDGRENDGHIARGVLEAELLAFSDEPSLVRLDGKEAISPACQFALNGIYTGAIRPRVAGDVSQNSDRGTHVARFAIDEVAHSDLRIHVFDVDSTKFSMGFERQAFCGGAFVPLTMLYRSRQGAKTPLFSGLFTRSLQTELMVRLLPVDALWDRSKLATLKDLKQPQRELGRVTLRLTLVLHERVPVCMFTALPYYGEPQENLVTVGRIDSPMSVVTAVSVALQRLRNVLDIGPCLEVLDQLRETKVTSAILFVTWTYAALFAPPWKLPGCLLILLAMLVWKFSEQSHSARVNDPPQLYLEESADTTKTASLSERGWKGMKNALQMELQLMQFAKNVTLLATRLERVRFLVSLRDPYLSLVCFAILGTIAFSLTVFLHVVLIMLGHLGMPILFWLVGCVVLLPRDKLVHVKRWAQWVKEQRERILGPALLWKLLWSIWQRIPDDPESQHFDLFERHVLCFDKHQCCGI